MTVEADAMATSIRAAMSFAGNLSGQVALAWCNERQLKQLTVKPTAKMKTVLPSS